MAQLVARYSSTTGTCPVCGYSTLTWCFPHALDTGTWRPFIYCAECGATVLSRPENAVVGVE